MGLQRVVSLETSEYIMRNAGLEETQAGIKIARRNINKLRYADGTTLLPRRTFAELRSLGTTLRTRRERSLGVWAGGFERP